jgi:O-antigen/teichoic acid export membrane protein
MNLVRIPQIIKSIPKFFRDTSLTKKAFLNALASALDYSAKIIVTPFMVTGLGDYFYGAWQILMRVVGYMSPASGRPTQALKFVLAKEQNSPDYERKRIYVGSTFVVLAIFFPLMAIPGGVLSWYIPYWIKTPDPYIWYVRIACGILVLNLITVTLAAVPQAVLEGENKGYKRMGLATLLVFLGGGLTWLALDLNTGIIGISVAGLLLSLIQLGFYFLVVRSYIPWFGVAKPVRSVVNEFLKLSGWFMAWNLIITLMTASDVVVLGLLNSVESVTMYTLSKYVPETVITVIAMMVFGILPGLSGIIGSGDLAKAARVRGEIMTFTWLIVTVLGTSILLWNRTFIGMWVGNHQYVGNLVNLLIVISVMQFVLIRNDANVIDLTLRLKHKVYLGAGSVVISILAACILVYFFKLGVVGVIIGIILGRLILTVAYPRLIGRLLNIGFSSQIKATLRPTLVTTLLFLAASGLETYLPTQNWISLGGWILFALSAGMTACFVFGVALMIGLTKGQRKSIIKRFQALIQSSGSKDAK